MTQPIPPVDDSQVRTYSLMALGSGAASLASLGACIVSALAVRFVDASAGVVIIALPALSFSGAIMGGLALRSIRKSEGALGGRPVATVGLFVGIGAGVLQASVALSALATFWPVRTVLAPEVDAFFSDLATDRWDAARARLSVGASEDASDARLDAFISQLEERLGEYQQAGFGLDVFTQSRERLQSIAQRGMAPGATMPTNSPRPVGLTFAASRAIAYVFVDQGVVVQGQVRIDDVLVLMPDDRGVTLRTNGDARRAAQALGVALMAPQTPSEQAEGAG